MRLPQQYAAPASVMQRNDNDRARSRPEVLLEPSAGAPRAVGDKAAIEFSAAFYQAIGSGRSVKVAFLAHLGLPTEPPPLARARDPAQTAFGFE
jgi:hypothetical protein